MARSTTVETAQTIKHMAKQYREVAKEQGILDLEWYAHELIKVIDELIQNDWPGQQIKEQILGRLSGIIP